MKKSSFVPVRKRMIHDELYDQIVSMISKGELKPGEKLPPERELAKQLKVSRHSIREALKKAGAHGLVEVRQGEGTFVLSMVSNWTPAPLLIMMTEEVGKVNEFLELRKILEVWCAQKAAECATVRELKNMKKELLEMEKLIDSPDFSQLDFDFHLNIVEVSHNTLMLHMFASLKHVFEFKCKISSLVGKPEKDSILYKQHYAIYEAIKHRNPDLAGQKMAEHLQFVEQEWIQDIRRYRARQNS
jgi:GntR family transcriptional repressor for pyruvate dehydrogenase complex